MYYNTICLYVVIGLFAFVSACGSESATDAERIARAYGIDRFDEIESIKYTFNVEYGVQNSGRSWIWEPKTTKVTYEGPVSKDSVITYSYFRNKLDTTDQKMVQIDRMFINDKYWLLFPFNLVWDEDITITESGKKFTPILRVDKYKMTVQYGKEGGYTPGDAYDVYYDKDDYLIDVWTFRKGGAKDDPRPYTWEEHQQVGPIIVCKVHYSLNKNFKIHFTDVAVKTAESSGWEEAAAIDQARRIGRGMGKF